MTTIDDMHARLRVGMVWVTDLAAKA